MLHLLRRAPLSALCGFVAVLMACSAANAQDARVMKIILPFAAGDLPDIIARSLANDIGKELGRTVVIDNRPGASGLIGLQALASAEPDGLTIGLGAQGPVVIGPLVNKWPLDVRTALVPIALAYINYVYLATSPKFTPKNLTEIIAYSKAHPGTVRIGTLGHGSFTHLFFELLRKQAGLDYMHIPYRTSAQLLSDLTEGRIDISLVGIVTGASYSKDGRLRGIAVTGRTRDAGIPDTPTVSETAPGLELFGWFGYFAPKGTPPDIIDKINAAVNRALLNPETIKLLQNQQHLDPAPGSPADFRRLWDADYERLSGLIRELGIVPQ